MNKLDKDILVIETDTLLADSDLEGFQAHSDQPYLQRILKDAFYKRRGDVEEDPTYLQPIPYVVVMREGQVLAYLRTHRDHESRLSGMWSWGAGGHIDREDHGSVMIALGRELHEEFGITDSAAPKLLGYLRLTDTPISRVHFGIVYSVEVTDVEPSPAEVAEVRWIAPEDLSALSEDTDVEGWSKAIIPALQ